MAARHHTHAEKKPSGYDVAVDLQSISSARPRRAVLIVLRSGASHGERLTPQIACCERAGPVGSDRMRLSLARGLRLSMMWSIRGA
jgi:hypothetical protein